jgi:hypothetical protein
MNDTSAAMQPPSILKTEGKKLWNDIQREYGIGDSGGLSHLETACRCMDDITKFRELVECDGALVPDRFGQLKPHPLISAIRDLESTKRQSLLALNLDVKPAKAPGRPPGR